MSTEPLNPIDLDNSGLPEGLDELTILKNRAKSLGINHSNNIGVEALREKIRQKLEGENVEDEEPAAVIPPVVAVDPQSTAAVDPANVTVNPASSAGDAANRAGMTPMSERQKLIKEATMLVRCRITNLDPKKKAWPGEFFTVANEYVGTHKKFVPYGEAGQAYHLPKIIFDMLKEKQYLHIRTFRDPVNKEKIKVEEKWMPEFSLEILPNLTPAELEDLKKAQNASGRVDLND